MIAPIPLLLSGLAVVILVFVYTRWRRTVDRHPHGTPTPLQLGFGTVGLFFDTLGIGNYAPTTAAFRFVKIVPDELIPGTEPAAGGHPLAGRRRRAVRRAVLAPHGALATQPRLATPGAGPLTAIAGTSAGPHARR